MLRALQQLQGNSQMPLHVALVRTANGQVTQIYNTLLTVLLPTYTYGNVRILF